MPKPRLARVLAILCTLGSGGAVMEREAAGQPARGCTPGPRAVPLVQLDAEPPARITVDPPVPLQLAQGRAVIVYCTENLLIRPVYGEAAAAISPRVGHIHVTVDGGPMRWIDASGEPLVINKLPPGPHTVLLELVDPTHRTLHSGEVSFVVTVPPPAP